MFASFNALLARRPLQVKAMTGAVLTGTGDVIAQTVERRNLGEGNAPSVRRLVVFASFGALWTGPFNHYWLGLLAKRFPPTGGWRSVAGKLLVQHALWNPVVYLPVFFTFNGLGMGKSWSEIEAWVRRDYWGMLVWCWVVWVPITGWMFVAVPERFQSILMSGISLAWNSFLSWRSFNEHR